MAEEFSRSSSGLVIRAEFGDFDAFCEAIPEWDAEFRQLAGTGFHASMTRLSSASVQVLDARFSSRLLQMGAPPPGYWTFGVPADPGTRFSWRGHEIGWRNLVAFPRGGDMESVSHPDFHQIVVSIAEERVDQICASLELPPFEKIVARKEAVTCPPNVMERIRRQGTDLIQSAGRDPFLVRGRPFRNELQVEWPEQIVRAFATSAGVPRRKVFPRRQRALKKALRVIHDRADDPVSVSEIEQLCGASGRTLRYAFEDEFGLSPKRYLEVYRLNQLRRALRESDRRKTKIADAANEWGFWHMGKLAGDYRRLFGELPSETLAR